MASPEMYMHRALELAALAREWVSPNPMVGCVIVHDGKIIGEGFHQKFGGPHAEVNAIESVADKNLLPLSTVYVNLEPCSHFGKTPPCADLLIKHKVRKVVICNFDPNPLVGGNGVEKLKNAGIEVETGLLEAEGETLNQRFFKAKRQGLPYIIIKWAETADGFVSFKNGSPASISNPTTNIVVHRWRAEEDAIMVGSITIRTDNPNLTCRHWPEGENPVRVIIDRALSLNNESYNIFDKKVNTIIFNDLKEDSSENLQFLKIEKDKSFLINALRRLVNEGINSVLVEGGPSLIRVLFEQGLYDEIRVIKSKKVILDEGIAAPHIPAGNILRKEEWILDDKISYYF